MFYLAWYFTIGLIYGAFAWNDLQKTLTMEPETEEEQSMMNELESEFKLLNNALGKMAIVWFILTVCFAWPYFLIQDTKFFLKQ